MIALVIGGTGSLGKTLVPKLLSDRNIDRVRVMSRDEHKQIVLEPVFGKDVDWFVGDVRDAHRVETACHGADYVYNLAAVKSVDKAEYNPEEAIKTNIDGARNVVHACLKTGVKKAVFTSTDKAVEPLNIYGASKLAAEKLFIQSNSYSGKNGTRFMAVRYGNVLGSNGSVVQKWREAVAYKGKIKLTDQRMTRFFMLQDTAANMVHSAVQYGSGGEVFIPKMKSINMMAMAAIFCGMHELDVNEVVEITGIRPGEKIHETLISRHELDLVTDVGEYYARWPHSQVFNFKKRGNKIKFVDEYTSEMADRFNQKEMASMIEGVLHG